MATDVSFAGTITVTNPDTGLTNLEKSISAAFAGDINTLAESISVTTSPSTIGLPASPTQVVYIKNNSLSFEVTVTWTRNGGASASVAVLEPGAILLLVETNSTSGITALSLVATGTSAVEYFLAA